MANKQTQELWDYNGRLPFLEDENDFQWANLLIWHEWENKRIELSKFVEYIQKQGIGEDYNDSVGFVGKSITVDKIKSSGYTTRGICFPNGISLCEKDIMDSWIGYYEVTPSNYGFDSPIAIPANVCYGTFGMETVYINDLYVKNLHTTESSSSGGSLKKDNAEIRVLVTDVIEPMDSCGLVHFNGGISFNGDNNGIFKYNIDTGNFTFDGNIETGGEYAGSLTTGLVSTQELSPKRENSDGDYVIDMYGGFRFVNVRPIQKYFIAGNDDNAVFNSNGGLTKIYSQTEIDTKLQPLTQLESYFKGSLGDFNSTSDFRSALNNMIKDKKDAGRYYATLYGSLIIVTFALLDKSSGTYSQWVEGSIIKGTDGELYLNNELGYRICGRVGIGTTWGLWRANVLDDELPIAATKAHDGLMSKEDKASLESMKTTIESLEARIAALEAK